MNPFIQSLKELGIKLNKHQNLHLYMHPQFGYNINNWSSDNLILLCGISGFGIGTILKIGQSIGITLEQKTKLIILYNLNSNSNSNTYINYDYDVWINEISNYIQKNKIDFNDIIDNLTPDKFNQIINEMIHSELIIKIDNCLFIFNIEILKINKYPKFFTN